MTADLLTKVLPRWKVAQQHGLALGLGRLCRGVMDSGGLGSRGAAHCAPIAPLRFQGEGGGVGAELAQKQRSGGQGTPDHYLHFRTPPAHLFWH